MIIVTFCVVFYLFTVHVCTMIIVIPEASCYFINSSPFRLRNQKKGKSKEKGQQCHEHQEGVRI